MRVFLRSFLCFFFAMRLRRFLITEPIYHALISNVRTECAGRLGYRGSRVKIETDSVLEVRAKTPNSLEMSRLMSSFWPLGALSAAIMTPLESKVRSNGVGDLGF